METVDNRVSIYGLHGPDQVVRYVGRTIHPVEVRLRQHRNCCEPRRVAARASWEKPRRLDPLYAWMIWTGPKNVEAKLLDTCTEDDGAGVEDAWVLHYRTMIDEGGYNRRRPC